MLPSLIGLSPLKKKPLTSKVDSNFTGQLSLSSAAHPKTPMTSITLTLPATAFSALRKTPDEFAQEMRIAAAIKWYELEQVSQGKAAEIAGLTRTDFIAALSHYQVSPFQYTEADLIRELSNAD